MREALMKAAMSFFVQDGIYATRIEQITERADLGKGAFYNYFDSKESLVAELVQEGIDLFQRDYLSVIPPSVTFEGRVQEVTRAQEAFFRENRNYAVLFQQARGFMEVKMSGSALLQHAFSYYLELVGLSLVPPEDENRLAPGAKIDIAALVIGAIAGYRSFQLAAGNDPDYSLVNGALLEGVPSMLRRLQSTAGAEVCAPGEP